MKLWQNVLGLWPGSWARKCRATLPGHVGVSQCVCDLARFTTVSTIARVAELLEEDEDWLCEVANEIDQEDGLIWVYGPPYN